MNKFVYLFELDSVRNTDMEIEIGQRALYNEIVRNGNVVVLTFNQLVDSRGFFSLLGNEDYYENIVSLFENGFIRISQFGDIRTISQYLLSSFEYEKKFIYSGWPLKSTQKRLLALIKRSLTYSDLSEINDYCVGNRTNQEISDLFIEVTANQEVKMTSINLEMCKTILKRLYYLLKTILRLSSIHTIYISPRDSAEYSRLKLHNIIATIENLSCIQHDDRLHFAMDIIKSLPCYGSDNRSDYLHALLDYCDKHDDNIRLICQYAEAIINLAYNYACEISICNISKHYDIDELIAGASDYISFETDFRTRLRQYWQIGDFDNRFLLKETNNFIEFVPKKCFPDFSKAVRLNEYLSNTHSYQHNDVPRYENKLKQQRLKHKASILAAIGKRVIFSLICFLIAFGVEILFQIIQNALDDTVNLSTLWWIAIETFSFICVTEILTSGFSWLLKKVFNVEFLTFANALGEIGKLIRDAVYIFKEKAETYINLSLHNRNNVERFSEGIPISFVNSASIKKYFKLCNTGTPLFSGSEVYPIARADSAVAKELVRLEELFNYQFGIVYRSKYNTLIVDPIEHKMNTQKSYYPYERIIPTSGCGVVMVTKHNDKFVILKQYRHAPRKVQYAFPRGYGEDSILSINNARKELSEELNATITETPLLIGKISPDSGLTSSYALVYLVSIESYEKNYQEGILDVIELSANEFENSISNNIDDVNGAFDDGFTIAAYMLYKSKFGNGDRTVLS